MKRNLPDLTPFFSEYEKLTREVDALFGHIRERFPAEVSCKQGCSSCCYALFDLSLIEALYINNAFNTTFPTGVERFAIEEKAGKIDRMLAKIKRQAYRDVRDGKESTEVLHDMARQSMRCPLLGEDDRCVLYEKRPITCRLYGVPLAIGGKAHTCGETGFQQGVAYPTVTMDALHDRLGNLSKRLADFIQTKYKELHMLYVPVSSALIQDYDAEYLGVKDTTEESNAG